MGNKEEWLKGVVVPVVTPFDDDENVNEEALVRLVDFLIEGGVNCLFSVASTSEFYRLSIEERKRIIDVVIDHVNGRVPVLTGAHTLSTKLSIEMAKYGEAAGANAIVVLHPYYGRLSEAQLFRYYRDICESVDLPVILYTLQGGVNELSLELISKIAEFDNVIGIKIGTCDMCRVERGVELLGDKISVMVGIEEVFVPGLLVGCEGGVIGTSNFCPEYWVNMYNLFLKGDIQGAIELQKRFSRLSYDLISKYGYHEVIKEALNLCGIKVGSTRRPRGGTLTVEAREKIREMLRKMYPKK